MITGSEETYVRNKATQLALTDSEIITLKLNEPKVITNDFRKELLSLGFSLERNREIWFLKKKEGKWVKQSLIS